MNESIILKLLNGTADDILIALNLLAESHKYREFFKNNGTELSSEHHKDRIDDFGRRYKIDIDLPEDTRFYFRISESYFILVDSALNLICECYENYDDRLKSICYESPDNTKTDK